jgi:hypothetical protein
MLPDMSNLLQKFDALLPDTLTFQTISAPTQNDRGVPIPGSWTDAPGLSGIHCIIETYFMRRSSDGEILSPEGQVEPNTYRVLLDHVYTIDAEMRCVDQRGVIYEVKQVTHDDHNIGTLLKIRVVDG